ncbi:Mitochondrial transcription termination factor family protein isoform 2 [Cucumis melo var. makuwa]|uniref:Mitochondrial transcription termination factor family protein isoform 2 n=1 Tax=Cucumis melo var. makuwa TaxID=1194695 RepID=A0A5A7T0X2_CUCMM|nr:Mitochondrial transcription termination factor family protein isoform 2 [Cucumis melo var. makuwa]TYK06641.1 Mitochondrial transcription termination factor family protein isoform 2 [Cucumis melo var. makuwa]
MLGKSLASPISTIDSATRFCCSTRCTATAISDAVCSNVSFSYHPAKHTIKGVRRQNPYPRKWEVCSSTQVESLILSDEDKKTWEACRQALSVFSFSVEEQDKMLGKAFGHIHSPYWGEDRKKKVPNIEIVNDILEYLRTLGLSNDDLSKLLKKFPEVLGCNLEQELKTNVQLLDKEWGIQGKSLRNLLLRNPKSYNGSQSMVEYSQKIGALGLIAMGPEASIARASLVVAVSAGRDAVTPTAASPTSTHTYLLSEHFAASP